MAASLPGGGGVLLPDSGHVGVLFPLCPASKCLSGGVPGLPPEPSVKQYPLKGPLDFAKPHAILDLWPLSQCVGMGRDQEPEPALRASQAYGGTVQGWEIIEKWGRLGGWRTVFGKSLWGWGYMCEFLQ